MANASQHRALPDSDRVNGTVVPAHVFQHMQLKFWIQKYGLAGALRRSVSWALTSTICGRWEHAFYGSNCLLDFLLPVHTWNTGATLAVVLKGFQAVLQRQKYR